MVVLLKLEFILICSEWIQKLKEAKEKVCHRSLCPTPITLSVLPPSPLLKWLLLLTCALEFSSYCVCVCVCACACVMQFTPKEEPKPEPAAATPGTAEGTPAATTEGGVASGTTEGGVASGTTEGGVASDTTEGAGKNTLSEVGARHLSVVNGGAVNKKLYYFLNHQYWSLFLYRNHQQATHNQPLSQHRR